VRTSLTPRRALVSKLNLGRWHAPHRPEDVELTVEFSAGLARRLFYRGKSSVEPDDQRARAPASSRGATLMGSYITFKKKLPDSPKLHNAAEKLAKRVRIEIDGQQLNEDQVCHALCHALLGVTVTLWARADEQVSRDNTLPWSVTGVQREVGCHAAFLAALPEDWLQIRENGAVELPQYVERNALIPIDERKQARDDKREKDRLRQQRHRAKKRSVSQGVTRDKPAPRDVTRDSHARHAPTGTETGNRKPVGIELARAGNNVDRIVRLLCEYEVTPTEVGEWIGDETERVA
jgi:hypothetical protein